MFNACCVAGNKKNFLIEKRIGTVTATKRNACGSMVIATNSSGVLIRLDSI